MTSAGRNGTTLVAEPFRCVCKGWRGRFTVLLWGVAHVFCDACKREVRNG